MEVVDYRPQGTTAFDFPFEPIKIRPLGDIQTGADSCDLDLLQQDVDEAIAEGAYFIGMGDYIDVASPSNRKIWAASGVYDSMRDFMDDRVLQEQNMLMDILRPTKGKWLGMVTGHHWWQYQDGTTTDTNLCRELETVHLGSCGLVNLYFKDDNKHSIRCTIYVHHGVGSGKGAAAPITKLEEVVGWAEADIYLMGHQHKLANAKKPRFYQTEGRNPVLVAHNLKLMGTGSYLQGYMQDSKRGGVAVGTYVEQAQMTPVALGSPLITVTPKRVTRKGKDMTDLIVKALA